LSLVVPSQDVELFRSFASERRRLHAENRTRVARQHWLSMLHTPPEVAPAQELERRGSRASQGSRAELVAQMVLQRIIDRGWPIGQPLGAEADLMRDYKVSRAVIRQATRLLVHHSVVRMVRGSGGGLVVAEPDLSATMRAVSLYLEFCRIRPADVLETRLWLETATISRAVATLTSEGEDALRDAIAREAGFDADATTEEVQYLHLLIAELCGDPALGLFARIVLRLSEAHSNFADRPVHDRARVVRNIRKLHAAIVEAMLSRDGSKAIGELRRYLHGYKGWMKGRDAC
jgi:DNA-binding FadR family transcriptional regulator